MGKRVIKFLMDTFDRMVIIGSIALVSFILIGFVYVSYGFLKDVVPIERTKFDSYEEFRRKTEVVFEFFPDDPLPSSARVNYYHYSVKLDRQSAVSLQLEETAYEEQKRKYVEKGRKRCDEMHEVVHQYVLDEGEPLKVTKEFIEANDLMFVEHVCSKDIEEYVCVFDYKLEISAGFSTWGILCNDETRELIFYEYYDNEWFGVGNA